ncbi:hypothetical protein CK503_14230 [Aliifodinibius salipaludis]|uniref:Alpha-L-glutamate ligase-related protein ATP-grasp domain-containing protein n=1 Tax=Fodinibius salipaludis TaxID=2032627 RepID=A0A2A2G7K5_9BACT|nr:sugar-transfer associated ATP-grasp domain-containing protein [Aliifodinibius salipaludis]PAU92842.1 hypothetical protein CK503_14230 [Aliifodinibius salipaludis]
MRKEIYSKSTKILYRLRLMLERVDHSWKKYVATKMSRDAANNLRKQVVAHTGKTVVDKKMRSEIKAYCAEVLGDASYWPWLAYYAELRGEFKKGWMPDDYYRFKFLPKMNPEKYMRFSEAKAIDHKLFNGAVVDPFFTRTNGQYYHKDGTVLKQEELDQILQEVNDEIIIKPDSGRGGQGIIFTHPDELHFEKLPKSTDLIFQPVVQQHPELQKLYPHSVNTLRVLTLLDDEGTIQVKFIIIRFGREGSRVDNASRGGGWVFVNIDGTVHPTAFDSIGLEIGKRHPDTGMLYSDLKLPFLPAIISLCKSVHHSFPYTRVIGWDIFVNEQEEPKIIEWNANNPFFDIIEARFGPFFSEYVLGDDNKR